MVMSRAKGEKRWLRLPDEVRAEVIRRARAGQGRRQILEEVDISVGSFLNVLKPFGGVLRAELATDPSPHRLSLDDRVEIRLGIGRGETYQAIADRVGRHKSSVWREVDRNGGREAYRPMLAHKRAHEQARRAKPTKLASCAELAGLVEHGLRRLWSPQQIAADLKEPFGDDESMTVSHETIYKSLYVQGRGELRRELTSCLRTGRAKRVPSGRSPRPRMHDMVMISERPAEVEDRAVPGHWEGDLIIGKDGKSAVGTLVERSTRYVMLMHLDGDRTAATVRDAMTTAITGLPEHLRRSITWDQGIEMAEHVQFTIDTDVPVYFCDPHSPWQRGSNENTNGLLRQYMPKGTDLSVHTPADLNDFAESLNTRPRQTLGWKTPAAQLAQLVAPTG